MGEFIVENVKWKKGEQGIQKFILFESDGVTRRNGSGNTYDFAFWKSGGSATKGSGSLTATDAVQGEHDYVVVAGDTDTVDEYIGELIENPGAEAVRSETFDVTVEESSNFT